jgi:hypothetical protein
MMEDLIDLIVDNLGIGFENLVLVLTILGSLILFAKDLRLGATVMFMFFAIEFIIFYNTGLETLGVLIALLVSLVVLTLSLYLTHSKASVGII